VLRVPLRSLLPLPGRYQRHRTAPYRARRQSRRSGSDAAKGKPEIFDAWTEKRTVDDVVKWEGSVPFSATLVMEGAKANAECKSVSEVSPRASEVDGGNTKEEVVIVKEEQRLSGPGASDTNGSLRVAVLLRMPSQSRTEAAHSDVSEVPGCPVQGELAIGLIEVPWTREDHYSSKGLVSEIDS